jgi:phosphopantothenoylcysteine decarboxylase / phosphopantothenate---cysteine ligase
MILKINKCMNMKANQQSGRLINLCRKKLIKSSLMNKLSNKNILLGITGGIAAYKSADLVRRLQDAGAEVRVVMTDAATKFITPLTFQALSGNPVHTDLLDTEAEAAMGHIELARWADAILIAPATANTLAKLIRGQADDLLSTLCLASQAPLAVAPAMNHIMWNDATTQDNINSLKQRGITILGPDTGYQACGETGEGRMLAVTDIVDQMQQIFGNDSLLNLNIMITAGPTFEAIDPVRFIGNRSSGKMGFAIAEAARKAGAKVTLVCGPVKLTAADEIKRIDVESAQQMHGAVMDNIANQNIFIATAAVADYRPVEIQQQKIKKSAENLTIHLQRNADILADVTARQNAPFTVGFAAETQNIEQYAQQKLARKNLNMIAANQVAAKQTSGEDIGFNSEYNALDIYWSSGHIKLDKALKTDIAQQLIEIIAQQYMG